MVVSSNSTLGVINGITNNGTILVASGVGQVGHLSFAVPETLAGSGSIVLGGNPAGTYPATLAATGGSLTQAAGHTISGAGVVSGGSFINQGLLDANTSGQACREFLRHQLRHDGGDQRGNLDVYVWE